MFDLTEGLDYEDREVFRQVFKRVFPQLTAMQQHCLLLSTSGYTQEEIGEMLGIGQQAVSRHFLKALDQVKETADDVRRG
jgi:RNA polymerase sigma factor (sigma-70 family)